jgi:TRAP-type mannitol/chloroaromatic compound transport system permease small subunit
MPRFIVLYVRVVDRVNRIIGLATLYMIFAMIGVLFYSTFSKAFAFPALWTLDFAQFLMMAYFMLGGAYALQLGGHVRMDLLYSTWSERTQNRWDSVTILCLIFFLVVLLIGAVSSTIYSIQFMERSFSAWRPYMWPIKVIMTFGIFMMLLQSISEFFKNLAAARGEPLK